MVNRYRQATIIWRVPDTAVLCVVCEYLFALSGHSAPVGGQLFGDSGLAQARRILKSASLPYNTW